MKGFFEKLRDILYDSTDYIIILAVIAVVVFIINWRLGGLFAGNDFKLNDQDEIIGNTQDDSDEVNETEINEDNTQNEDKEKENSKEIIHVDIPSGSMLSQIAEILVNKDLIQTEKEFIDKAVELNFETKLRSGEFDVPKDSSIDEILDILIK